MKRLRLFNAIIVSVLCTGALLVALALATVQYLDKRVIEEAATRNRHAEFIRAAGVVTRGIAASEDLHNSQLLQPVLQDIQELRPGIRALEIWELHSRKPTISLQTGTVARPLLPSEISDLRANKVLSFFDDTEDRAWVFSVPLLLNREVIGALRGRFSVSKYDELIQAQAVIAKQAAVGSVVVTSLCMLLLIRLQIHRPISRLLTAMDEVRLGNLGITASLKGPVEIRRLVENFNRMMRQIHSLVSEKDKLVHEIQTLNDHLEQRVSAAVSELEKEKDRVTQAQLLAQRNSQLAALGEISAIVAHELGNPLNALHGRLQLIKQSSMSDVTARHVGVIEGQISRMTDVIQHILNSTRLEQRTSPVTLNDVIREVLSLSSPPGITVALALTDGLPPIAVNRMLLHGVVLNLITNAIQAMGERGTLTLRTGLAEGVAPTDVILVEVLEDKTPMVRLSVTDSGVGIPDTLLAQICEPFFTTRHDQGGTGLGLAICRRVVASSAGRLAVRSSKDGTCFTIDFPIWNKGCES
jgi:signal transduction histidine kinase